MAAREIVEFKQPIGQGARIVAIGDCAESIAQEAGHFWKTLWNHADNKPLRDGRPDPNLLLPGDRITVPPRVLREGGYSAGARHRFRRKGVPSRLRLVIRDLGDLVANQPYTLEIDGEISKGQTDANGQVDLAIPPQARAGLLRVGETNPLEFSLNLGAAMPLESVFGLQARLTNLGLDPGSVDGRFSVETQLALNEFCSAHGLEPSPPGTVTRDVLDKLKELHGF